jgi:ABC-2 type transport system permease protein
MFYLSIGCLASALTKNRIVAATISFALISLMFFLSLLSFIFLKAVPRCVKYLLFFDYRAHGRVSRGLSTRVPSFFTLA